MINIQSTIRTAPDLCKNVSLPVLFVSNGSSYTVSTLSDMRIHEALVGGKKEEEN
jgi:hypothetical protein